MITLELRPTDGRKSFYGKAVVAQSGETVMLFSYNTTVCSYNTTTGDFKRFWSGYSATTMRHVNAFIDTHCPAVRDFGGKTWWESLVVHTAV